MGTVAPDFETQGGLDERFASALAHVAANDTPLIDERAATRGNRKGRCEAYGRVLQGREWSHGAASSRETP